jgi:hypothetical protein
MLRSHRIATYTVTVLATAIALASTFVEAKAATSSDRLPALIKETSAQFQLAYRMRPNEVRLRQEQLDAAVAAWRAAPRSAANDERLANWLRTSIRASMPGQREPLPPTPDFKSIARPAKPASETAPVERSLTVEPTVAVPTETRVIDPPKLDAETVDKPVADPPTADPPTSDATDEEPTLTIEEPAAADENTDPFRDDPIQDFDEE